MCGFTAVVSLSIQPLDPSFSALSDDQTTSKLDRSLEAITHRGPDARGKWTSEDGRVGECLLESLTSMPMAHKTVQLLGTSASPLTI